MTGRPLLRRLAAVVVVGCGLQAGEPMASFAQSRHQGGAEDVPSFVVPERAAAAPRPALPPNLPAPALVITPATLEVQTSGVASGTTVVQTVTRTAERVHIDTHDGREWLYVRNPADTRRVSARLIDHASQTIVVYDESDLRNVLGTVGWLDVVSLGISPDTLAQLRMAGGERRTFGLTFRHFVAPAPGAAAVRDVWWQERELFALEITRHQPGQGVPRVVTVREFRPDVEEARLAAPAARFPHYRQVDFADWLEGLHER
jgi:hypothetical protein